MSETKHLRPYRVFKKGMEALLESIYWMNRSETGYSLSPYGSEKLPAERDIGGCLEWDLSGVCFDERAIR